MAEIQEIQGDPVGNTKNRQDSPCKKWFFTLKKGDLGWEEIYRSLDPITKSFVYQEERGEQLGYCHYQGMMCLLRKMRFGQLCRLLPNGIHLEKCRDELRAREYCTKEATRVDGPWSKGFRACREKLITEYRPWQGESRNRWLQKAPQRLIEWWADPEGGNGKSTFGRDCYRNLPNCKYTKAEKAADILMIAHDDIRIYIIDIPRDSMCRPYNALEALKDGFVTDCKLRKEQRVVDMYETPHVIVFANFIPDFGALSMDRWDLRRF